MMISVSPREGTGTKERHTFSRAQKEKPERIKKWVIERTVTAK